MSAFLCPAKVTKLTAPYLTFMATSLPTKIGCTLFFVGFLMHMASMISPYWEFAQNESGSSHSGLWKVCIFEKCGFFIYHNLWGEYILICLFLILFHTHTYFISWSNCTIQCLPLYAILCEVLTTVHNLLDEYTSLCIPVHSVLYEMTISVPSRFVKNPIIIIIIIIIQSNQKKGYIFK